MQSALYGKCTKHHFTTQLTICAFWAARTTRNFMPACCGIREIFRSEAISAEPRSTRAAINQRPHRHPLAIKGEPKERNDPSSVCGVEEDEARTCRKETCCGIYFLQSLPNNSSMPSTDGDEAAQRRWCYGISEA